MRIGFEIERSALPSARAFAFFVAQALPCLVALNRVAIARGMVPRLYQSGVRFKEEPKGTETFVDAVTCYRNGWGDCAHLAAWCCAERQQLDGLPADIYIRWPRTPNAYGGREYHVCVRLYPGGPVEDPSAKLGMYDYLKRKRKV